MENADSIDYKKLAIEDPVKWLDIFRSENAKSSDEEEDSDYLSIDYLVYGGTSELSLGGLTLEIVHEEGGYEGCGDYAERVFAIRDGDRELSHIRVTGFYSSYEGTWWDEDATRVYPRQVMVTQYFETP